MNLLAIDPGTMAGMTDEHFIASVEPLLMTPLEKELFNRFAECSLDNDIVEAAIDSGFDTGYDLKSYLNQPECPTKDVLDDLIDDALYLSGMFADDNEGKAVAERLHNALVELQGDLK